MGKPIASKYSFLGDKILHKLTSFKGFFLAFNVWDMYHVNWCVKSNMINLHHDCLLITPVSMLSLGVGQLDSHGNRQEIAPTSFTRTVRLLEKNIPIGSTYGIFSYCTSSWLLCGNCTRRVTIPWYYGKVKIDGDDLPWQKGSTLTYGKSSKHIMSETFLMVVFNGKFHEGQSSPNTNQSKIECRNWTKTTEKNTSHYVN